MCKYFKEIVILHNYNDICLAALDDSVQKLVFIFVVEVGNVINHPRREQSLLIRDKEIFVSFLDVGNLIFFLPIFFVEFHFFVDCFWKDFDLLSIHYLFEFFAIHCCLTIKEEDLILMLKEIFRVRVKTLAGA